MKDKVLAYWRGLKDQEQRLLLVAGGVFVIFVLYMGVVKPLQDGIKNAQKELQQQTELLAWVQESVVKLKASTPKQAQSNQSLSQVVNSTRGRYNINIAKMQPSDNALRLTIDSVEFNRLVSWIDELVSRHGVKIESLDLAQDSQPGYVRVSRLVLEN
ncbi:type II secretion system protein GspM [Pseudoalteromonas fenneropenaei]|uniref:Type II secretion system protein M n=1 Tax=Pseudoalteromonas fenneropenaei TaxID=1737459 RepID=A0ABV7CQ71_9GAMM